MPRALHPITGCRYESLFGLWVIEFEQLEQYRSMAVKVDLHVLAKEHEARMEAEQRAEAADPKKVPYGITQDGTAIIGVTGPMTKYPSSFSSMFGGSSTVVTGNRIRHAAQNQDVRKILLFVDSPGGSAAGTFSLANLIRRIDQSVKPVEAHIDDAGTSGAMLIASQARRVTANQAAIVGSIGAVTVLYDTSGKAEADKVRVVAIRSGEMKCLGVPGEKLTPEAQKHFQGQIDDCYSMFADGVLRTRPKLTRKILDGLQGASFSAARGLELGLIDDIADYDNGKIVSPVAVRSGPAPLVKNSTQTAPQRRIAMPLTAQQLSQARELPGASGITEENADVVLFGVAADLSQKLKTATTELSLRPPAAPKVEQRIIDGHVKLFSGEMDLAVKNGQLLAPQAKALKDYVEANKATCFDHASQQIIIPAQEVTKVMEMNKPHGLNTVVAGSQPAARVVPGQQDQPQAPMTLERMNYLRSLSGLPPVAPGSWAAANVTQADAGANGNGQN